MINENKIREVLQDIYRKGRGDRFTMIWDDAYLTEMVDEVTRTVLVSLSRDGTLEESVTRYIGKEYE